MAVCNMTSGINRQINQTINGKMLDYNLGMIDNKQLSNSLKDLVNNLIEEGIPAQEIAEAVYDGVSKFDIPSDTGLWKSSEEILDYINNKTENNINVEDNEAPKMDVLSPVSERKLINNDFIERGLKFVTEEQGRMKNNMICGLYDAIIADMNPNHANHNLVTNEAQLNENIREYQQELLNKVHEYLNKVCTEEEKDILSKSSKMYNEFNTYAYAVHKIVKIASNYLAAKKFSKEHIESCRLSRNTDELAGLELDAYEAWLLLTNFDSALNITFPELQVKNGRAGDLIFGKTYAFASKSSSNNDNWTNKENFNIDDNINSITKMTIQRLPRYIAVGNGQIIEGEYCSVNDFSVVVNKISDIKFSVGDFVFTDEFLGQLNKPLSGRTYNYVNGKSLKQIVAMTRRNPMAYYKAIFELLSNEQIKNKLRIEGCFTRPTGNSLLHFDDFNTIFSVYKGLFDETNPASMYNINKGKFDTVNILAYITQTADSIKSNHLLQHYELENAKGKASRELSGAAVSTYSKSLERGINAVNSPLLIKTKGYSQMVDAKSIKIDRENKTIEFNVNFGVEDSISKITYNLSTDSVRMENLPNGTEFQKAYINLLSEITGVNIDPNIKLSDYQINTNDIAKMCTKIIGRSILNNDLSDKEPFERKNYLQSNPDGENGWELAEFELDRSGYVPTLSTNDVPTLRKITSMLLRQYKLSDSVVIRDVDQTTLSSITTSRLQGSFDSQFELKNKKPKSATKNFIVISTPGFISDVLSIQNYVNEERDSIPRTSFSLTEATAEAINLLLVQGLKDNSQGIIGAGRIGIIPSTNSDKSAITCVIANLNSNVRFVDENGALQVKPLIECSIKEIDLITKQQLGDCYKKSAEKIHNDFVNLIKSAQQAGRFPAEINVDSLNNVVYDNFVQFNNLINTYYPNTKPVDWVNNEVYQQNAVEGKNIKFISQTHYLDINGQLKSNLSLTSFLYQYTDVFYKQPELIANHPAFASYSDSCLVNNIQMLSSFIRSEVKIDTRDFESIARKFGFNDISAWNDTYRQQQYIAKIEIDGQTYNILNSRNMHEVATALSNHNIELGVDYMGLFNAVEAGVAKLEFNPIIEKYNRIHHLVSQEWVISNVGSLINHPNKKAKNMFGDNVTKLDRLFSDTATRYSAQDKRNVSNTATKNEFSLNTLTGIRQKYRVAAIEDVKDTLYNITGVVDRGIKGWDGSMIVSPSTNLLENNSLLGQKAGDNKKQSFHFYDEETGTGGIIKSCGFAITNNNQQNIRAYREIARKMMENIWLDEQG